MLAYVFWHWPRADHDPAEYEKLQRVFHSSLQQSAPRGFERSIVFRLDGAAIWLAGAPAYADWYLVHDSAALDPLNVAAVSGPCEAPHAAVARAMAAGAGSLLTLRGSHANVASAETLTWLTKPRDMPYETFYSEIASLAPNPSTLWRRTMVLGPTPEFGLLSPSPLDVAAHFHPLTLGLTRIWPSD